MWMWMWKGSFKYTKHVIIDKCPMKEKEEKREQKNYILALWERKHQIKEE